MQAVDDVLFTLGTLPKRIRWLLEQAPTDLAPSWEYGVSSVEACAALARFLKPWARLDRARRIEAVELSARVSAADQELQDWERRVGSGFKPLKRRPKRRNEAVATAFADAARQIEDYLACRPALTPRQWVEQARDLAERLYVLQPRDAEYQHGISVAVSGLEQALGQLPG
ncbi:hypothetical protein [Lysobacter enzymogenes]|uniref:hypothetical protein n=1 Tax=Lysobacter enzymogenes TaxID=69 RepID=UPI001AFA0AFB|nr:hypothetical protein [Lysobacter enzymogenes]QQQ00907.1 hypothetical protein JHW41_23045 [Lysobacter enzymogenes]